MGSMANIFKGLAQRVPPRTAHRANIVPSTVVPVAVIKASHSVFQATPQRPALCKQPRPQTRSVATRSSRLGQA